ncbi:acyl-CoA dehydrogenase [Jatrophihabitans sp.]|uniref:acyl-CoA dehydrogenase n=1 Tax=Jatrophihabitans sp. TaxID=1932789 RepID=UPI002C7B47C7|nr:acyl-CoA dehydrogenase [Jatrophihabitans sp.]
MGHYKSNLRDIEFNLFEVLGTGERLGSGPFAELDADTVRGILAEVRTLAEGPLAASYADADRNPPVFDPATNSVTIPESFKKSYAVWQDAEWWRLETFPTLGGTLAPRSLIWSIAEMVLGANPAIWMYNCGPAFANIIDQLGTAEQRKIAQLIIDKRWGATMVLTEPDAGSDVGAGRTKAIRQDDGSWHIEGVKRFITSGEHDMADNIIHYVLARPEGAGPGTKGLSLFLVPKFHFDWNTGELGERNGVLVTGVEHKMGLKVSTTCEVTFGEKAPARGWLLGEVHDGIAQMFKVIEHARMMVGTKAYSELSAGYLAALDYAKTRVQSADLTRATDKTAPRVTIIHHPDVRRQLMLQKAYAEGLRALALYTASIQDRIQVAEYEATGDAAEVPAGGLADGGPRRSAKREDPSTDERLNDLLLPIVKGVGSERSYEQLGQALQVFGGSGFLQDYPLEQYIRDNKIDSLYEGTTAIQGQDFFFRKIVRDKGVGLGALSAEIQAFLDSIAEEGRLKVEREAVARALTEVGTMVGAMITQLTSARDDIRNVYKVGLNTTRLLMSCGDLAIGWLLLRQATVALAALDGNGLSAADQAFYEGKLAVARFFAVTVLPELVARRKVVESTDNAIMDVAEEVF